MDKSRNVLEENAQLIPREIQREGFATRVETINTMEAWLGTLPGHLRPNVRRPLIHTLNLADLLPLATQPQRLARGADTGRVHQRARGRGVEHVIP
jgi:type IV secretion system protein VirB4